MKKKILKLMMGVVVSVILIGCSCSSQQKMTTKNQKSEIIKVKKIAVSKLSKLDKQRILAEKLKSFIDNKNIDNIIIKPIKNLYKEGEKLSFEIDTVKKSGYIYIFALEDNKTIILYPNEKSPLSEITGKHKFPSDFGDIKIKMVKNCKSCNNEKSLVYALLTKEPISLKKVFSKAIEIVDEVKKGNSNIAIAKAEFIVQ